MTSLLQFAQLLRKGCKHHEEYYFEAPLCDDCCAELANQIERIGVLLLEPGAAEKKIKEIQGMLSPSRLL